MSTMKLHGNYLGGLKFHGKHGVQFCTAIYDHVDPADYHIVDKCLRGDQNWMRWAIAVLVSYGCDPYSLVMTEDCGEWALWVRHHTWDSRAAYYAGILRAESRRARVPKRGLMVRGGK